MIRVKATREGLVGGETACGWIIDHERLFVALPSRKALHKRIRVVNPANGASCEAEVLDVGPFNEHDDRYVFQPLTVGDVPSDHESVTQFRPAAEYGISVSGNGTNGAGIDLGEAVWAALGMRDNTEVDWEFL